MGFTVERIPYWMLTYTTMADTRKQKSDEVDPAVQASLENAVRNANVEDRLVTDEEIAEQMPPPVEPTEDQRASGTGSKSGDRR